MNIEQYAVISNDTIINVILWDGESIYETDGELLLLTEEMSPKPGIGWTRVDGEWVEPNPLLPLP